MKKTVDIHGKEYNRLAMMLLILVVTFAGMLNQTGLGTAIPTLMKDFNISMSTAQQATTFFLLANGIMVPVSAYLITKFSTKLLYIVAFSMLFCGTLLIALTPTDNWNLFLVGRIIQATSVGITMPLFQVVIVNMFPANKRGVAMGVSGIVVGMAPAIGPTLAGWILSNNHEIFGLTISNSWRNIFVLPLFLLALGVILAPILIKDVVRNEKVSLDAISLIYSIFGFGAFLWGFTNVSNYGWLSLKHVVCPIMFGTCIIILFIKRQLKLENPFLNVKVFKVKQFSVTTACIGLSMMAMMGVEMMLPLYLQNLHQLTPFQSGLVLLPGAIMMGVMSPIAGATYDKVGAKRLAVVGFSILIIGTVPFAFLTLQIPDEFITVLYAVRMFAIAMIMMPLTASAMSALPKEAIAHGTAANNTVRQIASAMVVALLSSTTQNVINANKPSVQLKIDNPVQYAEKMLQASLDGFHVSFTIAIAFGVVGFLLARMLRAGRVINQAKVLPKENKTTVDSEVD